MISPFYVSNGTAESIEWTEFNLDPTDVTQFLTNYNQRLGFVAFEDDEGRFSDVTLEIKFLNNSAGGESYLLDLTLQIDVQDSEEIINQQKYNTVEYIEDVGTYSFELEHVNLVLVSATVNGYGYGEYQYTSDQLARDFDIMGIITTLGAILGSLATIGAVGFGVLKFYQGRKFSKMVDQYLRTKISHLETWQEMMRTCI